MKKLKLSLEYNCFPICLYDDDGVLIDNDSPEELRSNNDLDIKLVEIQNKYNELFTDSSTEFRFIGFSSEIEKKKFENEIKDIYSEIKKLVGDKYLIQNEIDI